MELLTKENEKKKFKVCISEVLGGQITIKAKDEDDARAIVEGIIYGNDEAGEYANIDLAGEMIESEGYYIDDIEEIEENR